LLEKNQKNCFVEALFFPPGSQTSKLAPRTEKPRSGRLLYDYAGLATVWLMSSGEHRKRHSLRFSEFAVAQLPSSTPTPIVCSASQSARAFAPEEAAFLRV
jgi:hypothetical protein